MAFPHHRNGGAGTREISGAESGGSSGCFDLISRSAQRASCARCLCSGCGRYPSPGCWCSSGERVVHGKVVTRNLGGGFGLTVLVTGSVVGRTWDSCHGHCVVQGRYCQPAISVAPRWRGRFPELLLEVGNAVRGRRRAAQPAERRGADVVAGVRRSPARPVDLRPGPRPRPARTRHAKALKCCGPLRRLTPRPESDAGGLPLSLPRSPDTSGAGSGAGCGGLSRVSNSTGLSIPVLECRRLGYTSIPPHSKIALASSFLLSMSCGREGQTSGCHSATPMNSGS